MWLLRERLSYFRVKHLTSNWWPYMYTQKIANIFDYIQDHSRLGLENKFLENKSGRNFLRSTGVLYKFLPTNVGVCKLTFCIFIIQTSDRMRYFTIFQYKLHSVKIQDDQSWAFSETVQKIDLVTVFDAILTSRQTREKLQCLYENLMSNNFHRTAVLTKIWFVN